MKRKYIVIPTIVILTIVLIVMGVWWLNQPSLPFDKATAVKADWVELSFHPEENWMKAVYVEGKVDFVYVLSNGDCLLSVYDADGYPFEVNTNTPYQKWVQPICSKLSEGDRVKIWGFFWGNDPLPRIDACVIEKLR